MTHRILAITGPTSGIGTPTAETLAGQFDKVILLVRNVDKGKRLKDEIEKENNIEVDVVECDLADLDSVKQAGITLNEGYGSIDTLILNAGVVSLTEQQTKQGFELMMGTNYIGHFYLTHLLLPVVLKSLTKQIVIVSSGAYKFSAMKPPYFSDTHFNPISAYGHSKLGTLYLMQALFEKYDEKGLKVTAVHPGAVSTNLGKTPENEKFGNIVYKVLEPFFVSPMEGSLSTILAVQFPGKYNGMYMNNGEELPVIKHGQDDQARKFFMNATLDMLKLPYL